MKRVDTARGARRATGRPAVQAAALGAAAFALLAGTFAAADSGLYLGLGAGASRLEPESSTEALTVLDGEDLGFHGFVGYDINRWLSAEGYAADLGSAGIGFLGEDVGDVDYLLYGVRAIGYVWSGRDGVLRGGDSGRGGPSVYLAAGVGGLDTDSELEVRTDHRAHVSFAAGVELGFSRGVALRAEIAGYDTDARYASVSLLKRFGARDAPAEKGVIAPVPEPVETVEPVVTPPVADVAPEPEVPPNLNFAFDDDSLDATAMARLDAFAERIRQTDLDVEIDGHTDSIGPEAYNIELSIRRALAVRDHLVGAGIAPARLSFVGFGEARPVESNATEAGRAANRRAGFTLR